jgi:hypothetical protein
MGRYITGDALTNKRAVSPQSASAGSINGVAIDRLGYSSASFAVITGAVTGSPSAQTVDAKIQEADASGGTYTDVSGATVSITDADSIGEINVDLSGLKRYIRIVLTVSFTGGTSPAIEVASNCALGEAQYNPV